MDSATRTRGSATHGEQEGRGHPRPSAPHANTLLWVTDHCLRSHNNVNVIVVVMACCGDVPTLAAVKILRQHFPELRIRVINVVDLMVLQPQNEHPHGICDKDFDVIFTRDKPIIFAFHGYPWLIHRLTCRRADTRKTAPPPHSTWQY